MVEQIITGLITSIVTLAGGYLIYGPKLKIEQKTEFQKRIGEKKAEALLKLKEIINDCEQYDLFAEEEEFSRNMLIGIYKNAPRYSSIMSDHESFNTFLDKLTAFRKNEEQYLDREAAAIVLYLYKYLFELLNFMNVYYPHVPIAVLGTFVCLDLGTWAKEADEIVIRDINAAKTDMESHKGDKWEETKDSIYKRLYDNCLLKRLQNPPKECLSEGDEIILNYIDYLDSCEEGGRNTTATE